MRPGAVHIAEMGVPSTPNDTWQRGIDLFANACPVMYVATLAMAQEIEAESSAASPKSIVMWSRWEVSGEPRAGPLGDTAGPGPNDPPFRLIRKRPWH